MTDHQTETYKSMIAISIEAMKYCALANGGAAVALLSYLGSVHGKTPATAVPDLSGAMAWFLAGLVFAGLLIGLAYLTQLALYNESFSDPTPRKSASHKYPLWVAMACFALSIGSFGAGAWSAVSSWASPPRGPASASIQEPVKVNQTPPLTPNGGQAPLATPNAANVSPTHTSANKEQRVEPTKVSKP